VKKIVGDPAASGDIFAIGDDEMNIAFADKGRELLVNHLPPGPADDVAETENA